MYIYIYKQVAEVVNNQVKAGYSKPPPKPVELGGL